MLRSYSKSLFPKKNSESERQKEERWREEERGRPAWARRGGSPTGLLRLLPRPPLCRSLLAVWEKRSPPRLRELNPHHSPLFLVCPPALSSPQHTGRSDMSCRAEGRACEGRDARGQRCYPALEFLH